jgi:light-regulated signal transduction histidine kinase (bacteriophytochrome)
LFGVFEHNHIDPLYEGIRIDLAVARRIIHIHGGDIWVQAQEGEGATLNFTLGGNERDGK